MVTGPGDGLAASTAGRGHLRVSHAERDRRSACSRPLFVHGMLARDEFDLPVSQALASRSYAELAAVPPALPPGGAAEAAGPARARGQPVLRPGRVMAAATALYAGVQAFVFLSPWQAGNRDDPARAKIALFFLSAPCTCRFAHLCGVPDRRVAERRSSGRPPRPPARARAASRPGTRPSGPGRRASAGRPRSPAHGRS